MTNYKYKRIFIIVMDSVGIGEAPDALEFGDEGADTLGHIAIEMKGISLSNLDKIGLSRIKSYEGMTLDSNSPAAYGKMEEASVGKDTMTGHWEIMGLYIDKPFRTFPNGFPEELLNRIREATGRGIIGNKTASGTEILEELGQEHVNTGDLIIYTSADSVLQIAAHEDVVSAEELWDICKMVREWTLDERYMVGRIIARPFIGSNGYWERTTNRHDYALKPFGKTVMNELKEGGYDSIALGKISDIFNGEGITKSVRTISNNDGMIKLSETMEEDFTGICFLNLVDFDAKYGHRRDAIGYGKALEEFDQQLPAVYEKLKEDDLLIVTADHGNDPVHHGTDHTREYVPLLVFSPNMKKSVNIGTRTSFADIGATISDNFNVVSPQIGNSFLNSLIKGDM